MFLFKRCIKDEISTQLSHNIRRCNRVQLATKDRLAAETEILKNCLLIEMKIYTTCGNVHSIEMWVNYIRKMNTVIKNYSIQHYNVKI